MLKSLMVATTAIVALACARQVYAASPFGAEVVFGDSLSDDGNISIASGYPSIMKFTTNPGPIVDEDLASHYGLTLAPSLLGGSDYAFGGAGILNNDPGTPAGVPLISTQIEGYLAANPKLNPNALYSVLGGANDIFYAATLAALGAETSTQAGTAVETAAQEEVTLIGALKGAGAHYIIVYNLPDIGITPLAASEGPAGQAAFTALSQAFNTILNSGLGVIGSNIVPVNLFSLIHEVAASPQAYGFTNATTPACTTASSLNCTPATLVTPNAASTYLFADSVHPTTALDALIAQYVEAELAAPAQASLLAEAPLAHLQAETSAVQTELLYDQAPGGSQPGVRLFADGGYAGQTLKAQSYTPQSSNHDSLFTVGVDYRVTPDVSVGADLTGGTSTDKLGGGVGQFDVDSFSGSVFGQYQWRHQAYLNGSVGFGTLQFDNIQRIFKLGAATRVEHGKDSGSTVNADVTAGYWFGGAAFHTGPYVQADYQQVRVDGYNETSGDSSAMRFGDQLRKAVVGEAGWKLQAVVPVGVATLYPFAAVAYDYDADASQRYVSAGLTSMNGTFSMPGYTPAKSWASAQVGLNARFPGGWTADVAYQGRFGDSSQTYNGGSVGLQYAF
jgi:outer membrane lipase/esterase